MQLKQEAAQAHEPSVCAELSPPSEPARRAWRRGNTNQRRLRIGLGSGLC